MIHPEDGPSGPLTHPDPVTAPVATVPVAAA